MSRRRVHPLLRRGLPVATVVAWCTAFALTHVPAEKLPHLGTGDAALHAIGYFVLAGLLWATLAVRGVWPPRRATLVICVMIVYAALDEATQTLPALRRAASMADWLADVGGAVAAVGIGEGAIALALRRRRKR
ncbi:MAG: VanZ family protein [Phycisphaerae bacterium]|nr:VanZ family protein [Phycisphaerae bacterium]